jgi:acetate kinase
MADAILALNAGSSSIKFALYRLISTDRPAASSELDLEARGAVEGIATAPRFTAHDASGAVLGDRISVPTACAPPDIASCTAAATSPPRSA